MKAIQILIAGAIALGGLSTSALAANAQSNSGHNFALGLDAGTLGLGVQGTVGLSKHFNLRGMVNGFHYHSNGTSSNMAYNGTLKLFTAGALVDYLPWANSGFRLSAGALYNGNKLDVTATPTGGNYTINGHTYTAAQVGSITGQVKFNPIAPYVGFGYGNAIKDSGFSYTLDVGAMYMGSPKATLDATGTAAGLAADVAAQQAQLQHDTKNYKWYPVIQMGVAYRF